MSIGNNRDLTFDIVRVCCTIWIVGVWHLLDYLPTRPSISLLGSQITMTALACFMFISGYFIKKYSFSNINDVFSFYNKRFIRFYILYSISIITLIIGGLLASHPWFKDNIQIILSLLGLSSFFVPAPGTIWFMAMLMLFYLLTPILQHSKKAYRILSSITIYIIFIIYHYSTHLLDERILILFPFYILDLNTSKKTITYLRSSFLIFLLACFLWIFLSLHASSQIFTILYSASGIIILITVGNYISKINILSKFITLLSYISLCLYLFHRQVFELLRIIYNHFDIEISYLSIYLVFLPTAFLCAYLIQSLYDKILGRFLIKGGGVK